MGEVRTPTAAARDMYHTHRLIIPLAYIALLDVRRATGSSNKFPSSRLLLLPYPKWDCQQNRPEQVTMPAPPRGEFNNITLTRNPDHFFTQREVVPLRKMTTPLTIAQQGGLRSLGGAQTLGGDCKLAQAKTTTSAKKLTDYMKLNVRATIEPCDKYSEPVTSNMAYGWGTRIPQ